MNLEAAYVLVLLIAFAVWYCRPTADDDDTRRCAECDALWHADRVCPLKEGR